MDVPKEKLYERGDLVCFECGQYDNMTEDETNKYYTNEEDNCPFRNNGVDHKEWYELYKNDVGRYRSVWFLDVIVNDQQMERNKNGRERY